MASFRRELTTDLSIEDTWTVVTDLTGPGYWGRRLRAFSPDDVPVVEGTRLTSATLVADVVVVADVTVVRCEPGPHGWLVLHTESEIGDSTENVRVVATPGRGTVVEYEVSVDSRVDESAMRMWGGQFADECRDGLVAALAGSAA
ncbi:MAG: hypothetical protein Q7T56_14080 [Nocardioidaceae bacterium]|nr:hypothetical protein [Nocardioidaceae bacterium]